MRGLLEPAVVLHLPSISYAIAPMTGAVDPEAEYARQKIAAVTQNVFSSAVTATAWSWDWQREPMGYLHRRGA